MSYEIGSTLGDYQVVGILGAGGMGEVYKVRNTISDRVEAMKVLLPDLVQYPELADRFLREIKVQASLEHPNIASLHTALRLDNQLLMLMEYVEGFTLQQKAKQQGPFPVPDAVNYFQQVLSALEFAHSRGVVHRDIKPANMMLMPNGVMKLMDFGIAKAATDRQLTVAGTTLGSLYYMSPEQIQGSSEVDARSDLYSVGVSLYELVTGKRPFDGDSQYAIMAAHLEKAPVPPIQHDPRLPQSLNDIILMSVAKNPNERFQSAAAFSNALGRVTAPQETVTLPPVPVERRSNRGLWMGLGGLATAGVVIGLIQFVPWRQTAASPGPPAPKATAPILKTEPATSLPPVVTVPPVAEPKKSEPSPVVGKPNSPVIKPSEAVRPPGSSAKMTPPPSSPPPKTQAADPTPPVQQSAPPANIPPPVQQPAINAPSRAEMQEAREHNVMLGTRASVLRTSLQSIQRTQAAKGLNLRADMQEAAGLMGSYLDGANAALAAGDLPSAKSFMDKAERQIDKLEKFLGH